MDIILELFRPFAEFFALLVILLAHFFLLLNAKRQLNEENRNSAYYLLLIIVIGTMQIPMLIYLYSQKSLLFQRLMGYAFVVWSTLITCNAAVLLVKDFSTGSKN